jgi:hypothetical protein
MSSKRTFVALSLVAGLTLLSGTCASAPRPKATMLVPAVGQDGALEHLNRRPGTIAELVTVTGQWHELELDRSEDRSFRGHDASTPEGPIVTVPFDEVALVYYATPPHPLDTRFSARTYPRLRMPGVAEQRVSCADLDVELARTATIRWIARSRGAIPYTRGEATATHLLNGLVNVVAGLFGATDFSADPDEKLRHGVTAAQRRTVGLLELKRAKGCEPRTIAGTGESDLYLLDEIEGARRNPAEGEEKAPAVLARETAWLDELNPSPTKIGPPESLSCSEDGTESAEPADRSVAAAVGSTTTPTVPVTSVAP